jgi:hypothetical protein
MVNRYKWSPSTITIDWPPCEPIITITIVIPSSPSLSDMGAPPWSGICPVCPIVF